MSAIGRSRTWEPPPIAVKVRYRTCTLVVRSCPCYSTLEKLTLRPYSRGPPATKFCTPCAPVLRHRRTPQRYEECPVPLCSSIAENTTSPIPPFPSKSLTGAAGREKSSAKERDPRRRRVLPQAVQDLLCARMQIWLGAMPTKRSEQSSTAIDDGRGERSADVPLPGEVRIARQKFVALRTV